MNRKIDSTKKLKVGDLVTCCRGDQKWVINVGIIYRINYNNTFPYTVIIGENFDDFALSELRFQMNNETINAMIAI